MKQITRFILCLGILAALIPGAASSQAQDQITIALSPATVGAGQPTTVQATVTCPSAQCSGFKISVRYDPAMVRIDSIELGPYLGESAFLAENTVDAVTGTARLSAAAMGGAPAATDNVLFQLNLTGITPGTTSLSLDSLEIVDASGNVLPAAGVAANVTVEKTSDIPLFVPPDQSWELAFSTERDGNREIYLMNANGGNVRRLTDNPALDDFPAWSPDGSQIAFVSDRDGNPEIYVMNADGSNIRRLTNDPAADTYPSWSLDGSVILFMSDRGGNNDLYFMAADGSNPQPMTNDPNSDAFGEWSPNSSMIAFTSAREGSPEVFVMDRDGSSALKLTNSFGATAWYPDWSPNGTVLSFLSEREGKGDLYTMKSDGSDIKLLGDRPDPIGRTDWSPDGNFIALETDRDGDSELFVVDVNNGTFFRITENTSGEFSPAWRPLRLVPCTIRTDRQDVPVHVGPGRNRGLFGYLPANQDFTVIGQALDDKDVIWWSLQVDQITTSPGITSLWVASTDVLGKGGCGAVPPVEPPPYIPGQPDNPPPPGTWGPCGSCDTCGHPGECVTSPEGLCLWDPSTCHQPPPPPPPGDNNPSCVRLGVAVTPPNGGSAGALTPGNCPNTTGTYTVGTVVSVQATPAGNCILSSWSGCGASGSANPISITMTATCTITANFLCGPD